MIDVTTAGDDGHWDHADIKRLCAYRDRLKTALVASNQWLVSALTCVDIHWDAGQKIAATEAYENARATLASQSGHCQGY